MGLRSVGHHVESHGEASFPKITTLVLSEFSLRHLDFVHLASLVMHAVNLFLVLGILFERDSISCVSSEYVRMFML